MTYSKNEFERKEKSISAQVAVKCVSDMVSSGTKVPAKLKKLAFAWIEQSIEANLDSDVEKMVFCQYCEQWYQPTSDPRQKYHNEACKQKAYRKKLEVDDEHKTN